MASYDVEDLADALGIDAEDLAEELGYESLEAAEHEAADYDVDFGDFSDLDREDLDDGWAETLAELWDVDVSAIYDMYYGYEPD